MNNFTREPLYINDIVVYLKDEKIGSGVIRTCKFIGQITNFIGMKVEIHRLSPANVFVHPDELQDLGIDTIYPDDVVYVIISKHQEDNHVRTLEALNNIIRKKDKELKFTRKFIHEHGLEFELASAWDEYNK